MEAIHQLLHNLLFHPWCQRFAIVSHSAQSQAPGQILACLPVLQLLHLTTGLQVSSLSVVTLITLLWLRFCFIDFLTMEMHWIFRSMLNFVSLRWLLGALTCKTWLLSFLIIFLHHFLNFGLPVCSSSLMRVHMGECASACASVFWLCTIFKPLFLPSWNTLFYLFYMLQFCYFFKSQVKRYQSSRSFTWIPKL